ncbi:glycosyltransferase [Falsirhodobacter xinxiangensis]|uniref:glycosyltransferase n=1 Tax=Falsirhodobacter xinxiangensis TaxID=2530049 RepID=UPI0010AAC223|nr:glycosyltransferase [Rhodobacter xinxiangensis]
MTILVLILFAVHLLSLGLAGWRLTRRPAPLTEVQPVCLLVPVRGLDATADETLPAFLRQDHPHHRVLFCVEDADDPVIPLIHALLDAHPGRGALLVGRDPISHNPKLNNLVKGWGADDSDWVAMVDSNALVPDDYLSQLLAVWDGRTGLVTSPAVGIMPAGVWGRVEAAFLNTHQARWQFAADLFGAGFAQGKTLFWNRSLLDRAGGLPALGRELAEDVASTKLVRARGLSVRLVARPVFQPMGRRDFAAVWDRQLRWARIRRLGFPLLFVPELILGGLLPLGLLGVVAPALLPLGVALWYGAEWALARANGWPAGGRDVGALMLRDALMPALWLWSWKSRIIAWRGNVLVQAPG